MSENFKHKKSLGQYFLTTDHVPKLMCDAAKLDTSDLVVEVGPGAGILTREILARGSRVIALEADIRAIDILEKEFTTEISSGQLKVIHADARKLDLSDLGIESGKYKVVSNIPYYISGLLFRLFLDSDFQPNTLVFLIQKELAERIARDKKESLLSLSIKVFGDVKYVATVKRGNFTPAPKVDSAILAVSNISNSYFDSFDKKTFFAVIKAGFASKRKQLAPNIKTIFPVEDTKSTLEKIELPATSRAEDVSIDKWYQLLIHLTSTN